MTAEQIAESIEAEAQRLLRLAELLRGKPLWLMVYNGEQPK